MHIAEKIKILKEFYVCAVFFKYGLAQILLNKDWQ